MNQCSAGIRRKASRVGVMLAGILFLALAVLVQPGDAAEKKDVPEHYEPTWESLEKHPVPDWFHNAKFGIFIHWGVYSVPGWAPLGEYAEWYPRRMYQEGNPTYKYHKEKYGDPHEFTYNDFIPMFKAEKWDPDRWADLFEKAGARYVVPTGEHHDGFPLWDSDLTEFDAADMGPKRDLIGELAVACRKRGMKYAPSYHRMMNYYDPPYDNGAFANPHYESSGPDKTFVKNWKKRWEELRDKYRPDIIWFDGDWMAPVETWGTKEIMADYYNIAKHKWDKEVVVNDRMGKVRGKRGDFYTQEYEHGLRSPDIIPDKWESCRGIGRSFGYNRQEDADDYLPTNELVDMLVDIVSKNGNLLLDVGPKANGVIPKMQRERLLGMGEWLDVNGPAIYGTRAWKVFKENDNVRFTKKGDKVYAICLEWPGNQLTLTSLANGSELCPQKIDHVRMLGVAGVLDWSRDGKALIIQAPDEKPCEHAYSFEIHLTE